MKPLACMFFVVLLEALCLTAILPILPDYTEQLGGSLSWTGVMFAAMALPKVFTNPIWGALSDRAGRRVALGANTIGTFAGSILWALAPTLDGVGFSGLYWLILSRLQIGIFGGQSALAQAVGADVSAPAKRAATMGVLGAAFGSALALGPLLTWVVVGNSGDYARLGWVLAALQLASLAVIAFLLPETRPTTGNRDATDVTAGDANQRSLLLHRREVLYLLAIVGVVTWGLAEFNPTYPKVVEDIYQLDDRATQLAMAVFGFVAVIVQGGILRKLLPKLGEKHTALLGAAIAIVGFGTVALTPPLTVFWIASGLMAAGIALTVPCVSGMLSQRVEPDKQGALMGLQVATQSIGRSGGAQLGSSLYDFGGSAHGAYAAYSSATLILLAGFLMLQRVKHPS